MQNQTAVGMIELTLIVKRKPVYPTKKTYSSGTAFLLIGCGEDLLFWRDIKYANTSSCADPVGQIQIQRSKFNTQ